MNWETNTINAGIVKEMGKVDVTFKGTENLPKIKLIKAGCVHCTTYSFNESTKELNVTISLGQTPMHLRGNKLNSFDKRIAVQYEDGKVENLFIIGKKQTV